MFSKSMKAAPKGKVPTTPGAKPFAHPGMGPKYPSKGKTGGSVKPKRSVP